MGVLFTSESPELAAAVGWIHAFLVSIIRWSGDLVYMVRRNFRTGGCSAKGTRRWVRFFARLLDAMKP